MNDKLVTFTISIPRPNRRWLQFSLRTLLVAVVFLSVFASWVALRMQQMRGQREAAEAIRKIGGRVIHEAAAEGKIAWPPTWLVDLLGSDFFFGVNEVNLDNAKDRVTDDHLACLREFPDLRCLLLQSTNVTDSGLDHLRDLKKLEALYLINARVTNDALDKLKGLSSLRFLNLDGARRVTIAGLGGLSSLPQLEQLHLIQVDVRGGLSTLKAAVNLEYLHLGWTNLADADLADLRPLPNLSELNLRYTGVSDKGVAHLAVLPNLQDLDLVGTKVTKEGARALQAAFGQKRKASVGQPQSGGAPGSGIRLHISGNWEILDR